MARFGRKKEEKPKAKPFGKVRIHPGQKCYKCNAPLLDDEDVIVHMVNPVAWCIPCGGKAEETNPDLVKGVVSKDI